MLVVEFLAFLREHRIRGEKVHSMDDDVMFFCAATLVWQGSVCLAGSDGETAPIANVRRKYAASSCKLQSLTLAIPDTCKVRT